jgi:hypothetical protein
LNINFTDSHTLDNRITFSRPTTATCYNDQGILEITPVGTPRLDHHPLTTERVGLLIEQGSTNLLLNSNIAEAGFNATIQPNVVIAPDGTLTGDAVTATVAGTVAYAIKGFNFEASKIYVFSIFIKKGNFRFIRLSSNAVSVWDGNARFDLDEGKLVAGNGKIEKLKNDWFRLSATGTSSVSGYQVVYAIALDSNLTQVNAGFAGQVMYYQWGTQLELLTGYTTYYCSSYIPTAGVPVSRSTDFAVIANTNFTSWFTNANQFTMFIEWSTYMNYPLSGRGLLGLNGTTDPSLLAYTTSGGNVQVYSRGGTEFRSTTVSPAQAHNKLAFWYDDGDVFHAMNGQLTTGVAGPLIPQTLNQLRIGNNPISGSLNGHIKNVAYFPRKLSNNELQNLTENKR